MYFIDSMLTIINLVLLTIWFQSWHVCNVASFSSPQHLDNASTLIQSFMDKGNKLKKIETVLWIKNHPFWLLHVCMEYVGFDSLAHLQPPKNMQCAWKTRVQSMTQCYHEQPFSVKWDLGVENKPEKVHHFGLWVIIYICSTV